MLGFRHPGEIVGYGVPKTSRENLCAGREFISDFAGQRTARRTLELSTRNLLLDRWIFADNRFREFHVYVLRDIDIIEEDVLIKGQ